MTNRVEYRLVVVVDRLRLLAVAAAARAPPMAMIMTQKIESRNLFVALVWPAIGAPCAGRRQLRVSSRDAFESESCCFSFALLSWAINYRSIFMGAENARD